MPKLISPLLLCVRNVEVSWKRSTLWFVWRERSLPKLSTQLFAWLVLCLLHLAFSLQTLRFALSLWRQVRLKELIALLVWLTSRSFQPDSMLDWSCVCYAWPSYLLYLLWLWRPSELSSCWFEGRGRAHKIFSSSLGWCGVWRVYLQLDVNSYCFDVKLGWKSSSVLETTEDDEFQQVFWIWRVCLHKWSHLSCFDFETSWKRERVELLVDDLVGSGDAIFTKFKSCWMILCCCAWQW